MALNTHTVGDISSYVKRQFGDESGVQLIDSDIIRWVNQAQMEINSKNQILRNSAIRPSGSGTSNYDKPSDCLRVTAIQYDTTLLSYIGFDQYQSMFQGPIQIQTPTNWTEYGDVIFLAPVPDTTGLNIVIYYIPEPLTVSSTGSFLSLPDRYFDRICEYVMAKAYELDEDWNAHQVQRNLFEGGLNAMSNEETNAQGPYPVVVDYDYGGYSTEGWI